MPLAFANQNQTGISNASGPYSDDSWNGDFNHMMSQNKKPLIGVKRRLSGDNVYGDEPPQIKKCFNEGGYGDNLNTDTSMFCSKLQNMNIHQFEDTSKALIPVGRSSSNLYDNDNTMEDIDIVDNLNLPSTSERFFISKNRKHFPVIPNHLIQGNELVLFTPEHPINYYKNENNEEGDDYDDDYDRFMEGRIEELPNDYEVECSGNSSNSYMLIDDDCNDIFRNGIHPPTSNKRNSCIGVVELAEDDDDVGCNDLSRDNNSISNSSNSSTPLYCTIDNNSYIEKGKTTTTTTSTTTNNTTNTNQHFSHGPIFEELSDEDYCDNSTINDSPMEID